MARQVQGSNQVISNKQDIIDFLTQELKAKTTKKLGVEWEMFPYTINGEIPSHAQINGFFARFADCATKAGHDVSIAVENNMIIAVDLKNVGNLCIEPGGQIEFATVLCDGKQDVLCAFEIYLSLADEACGDEMVLKGGGQDIDFKEAPLVPRSRFINYARYIETFSQDIVGCIKSACSLQVNTDIHYDDFVQTYRAMIIAESLLAQEWNKTNRLKDWFNAFSHGMGNQSRPFFELFDVHSTPEALDSIASRLLEIKTPILPDPNNPEGYLFHNEFGYEKAPAISELMEKGMLTEKVLKNMMGLMMMFPAYRRPSSVETRGMDSPETLKEVMGLTSLVADIAYHEEIRDMFASAVDTAQEAEDLFGTVTTPDGKEHYAAMVEQNPKLSRCVNHIRGAIALIRTPEGKPGRSRPAKKRALVMT